MHAGAMSTAAPAAGPRGSRIRYLAMHADLTPDTQLEQHSRMKRSGDRRRTTTCQYHRHGPVVDRAYWLVQSAYTDTFVTTIQSFKAASRTALPPIEP